MYGISSDLQIEALVDSNLSQICVGKYDVQFRFDSGTYIAVQGSAMVLENNVVVAQWTEEAGWNDLSFKVLLNHAVKDYSIPNSKLLRIEFDEGLALELPDNSEQFESMQVFSPGKPLIVI